MGHSTPWTVNGPLTCGYHARGRITPVLILRCFWHSLDIKGFASDQISRKYRYYDVGQPVVGQGVPQIELGSTITTVRRVVGLLWIGHLHIVRSIQQLVY